MTRIEPVRFRLSRRRDARMADLAGNGLPCRSVARGSRWGNPFVAGRMTDGFNGPVDFGQCPGRTGPTWGLLRAAERAGAMDAPSNAAAVALYRAFVDWWRADDPAAFADWIGPLVGHNLGCWCTPDLPCHADILLELANG